MPFDALRRAVFVWAIFFALMSASHAQTPPGSDQASRPLRLVLAHYYYWYQGDARRSVPFARVRAGDGSSLLTDKPMGGVGPWFSYDLTQWHRDQMRDARRAGIDVLLPVFRGTLQDRKTYALKGLDALSQALKDLKAQRKDYPLIGMSFDTSSLTENGLKPDLTRPEAQRAFYSMIRSFFQRIPQEFRAQVDLPGSRGVANIVVLRKASDFEKVSEEALKFCDRRFRQEFGAGLVWIGGGDFKAQGVTLDGYYDWGPWQNGRFDNTGWIAVGAVSPGYNDASQPQSQASIRPRMESEAYRKDWARVLNQKPDWVIVETWNGYHEGSEVAPTRQYGVIYLDLTSLGSLSLHASIPYNAKFIYHNAPAVMAPRAIYLVDVTLRNVGSRPWKSVEGIALSYQWLRDGKPLPIPPAPVPVPQVVQPGQSVDMSVGVATLQPDGSPLPEGSYELKLDMMQGPDVWFAQDGSTPLVLPVIIGRPKEMAATVLSTTLPTMMKQGSTLKVQVRVRNDGSKTWRVTDGVALGYRWAKAPLNSEEAAAPLDAEGMRQVVPNDIEPGQVVSFEILVQAADRAGAPLPLWSPKESWIYRLQWDLFDGKEWLAGQGGLYAESVEMLQEDIGAFFLQSSTPKTMRAGADLALKAFLQNMGSERWTPQDTQVAYHWYYLDGIEAFWPGEPAPIPYAVDPGQLTSATVQIKAPPGPGEYLLVWDVWHKGVWASTSSNSRGTALLVVPVLVNGGPWQFVDLSAIFDTIGSTQETSPGDGSFDGAGNSLPAEMIPPEVPFPGMDGRWYPSGYWGSVDRSGWSSCRLIHFAYPPKTAGARNVVSCRGQGGSVPKGYYSRAHVLGAATSPGATGDFIFVYEEGPTIALRLQMSQWNEPPRNGERIGFQTRYRHTPQGDDPKTGCYLHHYVLPISHDRALTAIRLPNNPAMKIIAITLER